MPLQNISKEYAIANRIIAALIIVLLLLPIAIIILERLGHRALLLNALPCFVKQNTDKPCATCGLTRSILSLYKGHLQESINQHAYGYLFVVFLAFQLCLRIVPFLGDQIWIPYIDITQMLFIGIIWKILISGY